MPDFARRGTVAALLLTLGRAISSVAISSVAIASVAGGCAATPHEFVIEEGLRELNGTELYVKQMGSGTALLVVHGGPMLEHGYLLPHLAPLAQSHRLVFSDQRVCGRSAPKVEPGSVRISTLVDDIEALRQSLGVERIHLLGHSWGGLLAMHYALRYGDHLQSLILADPVSASWALWQQEEKLLAERVTDDDRQRRAQLLATEAFARREPVAIEELLLLSFEAQFHDRTRTEDLDLFVPEDYVARSQQFGSVNVDLESFDLHEQLASVTVPTLLIYGSREPALKLGGAQLHACMPSSELVIIDNAGHFPFVEQRAAFLQAVQRFLERVE